MYTPTTDPVISTSDDEGQSIIFTQDKWEQKKVDHPELMNATFMQNVQRTMENPQEVWPDYADHTRGIHNKQCYYRKYSPYLYVKVVVWVADSPRRVVSAYQIDCVKEAKYPGISRLR